MSKNTDTTVRVEGAAELRKFLRKLPPDLRKDLARIHKNVAKPVAEMAEVIVPRRSGRLRSTIRTGGTQRAGRVVAGRASVPYAGPIHWGWPARNIKAQPFLVIALEARQLQVMTEYMTQVDHLMDRVWVQAGLTLGG